MFYLEDIFNNAKLRHQAIQTAQNVLKKRLNEGGLDESGRSIRENTVQMIETDLIDLTKFCQTIEQAIKEQYYTMQPGDWPILTNKWREILTALQGDILDKLLDEDGGYLNIPEYDNTLTEYLAGLSKDFFGSTRSTYLSSLLIYINAALSKGKIADQVPIDSPIGNRLRISKAMFKYLENKNPEIIEQSKGYIYDQGQDIYLFVPGNQFAFGGSRHQQYFQKQFDTEDCSSYVGKSYGIVGINDLSTTVLWDAYYHKKDPHKVSKSWGSIDANLRRELLERVMPVEHNEINPGDIYLIQGHTGIVTEYSNGNIQSIEASRDMQKGFDVDGIGTRCQSYDTASQQITDCKITQKTRPVVFLRMYS